jgi:sugar phosphate isomerase/epimerase
MMKRRTMLKLVGATAAGALWDLQHLVAADKKSNWKSAVGLNGFMSSSRHYKKSYPMEEILAFAQRLGFDGVELVDGWPKGGYLESSNSTEIESLKRQYDEYGLQVFSIQLGAGGAFAPDDATRRRWLRETGDRIKFAKLVGCDCVGLWPGGPLRGQTVRQAIKRLADSFREVGKMAADHGLIAAFEIEPPFVFNTEEHLLRILSETNHPNLKTIYDPSHFDLMNGATGKPHELLSRVGVENIGYVHLTDTDGTIFNGTSKHLACGDGHAQINVSLNTLRKGGFEGWIMIDAWMIEDPYDACSKGKQHIDKAASANHRR